ncbi:MAG: FGGY-family carbohydrate kinase, partial [Planctomycetales bacterium]
GERTPHADPDARACFIGLTLAHDRGAMVRAVMEGVTYALRDSLEIIKELGVPVREIRASGGGARSPFWRQLQADMFGHKVVVTNATEGAAYGVALLATVGAGAYKNIQEACKATIQVQQETKPDKKTKRCYDKGHPVYQDLYRSLKDDFKKIRDLDG